MSSGYRCEVSLGLIFNLPDQRQDFVQGHVIVKPKAIDF